MSRSPAPPQTFAEVRERIARGYKGDEVPLAAYVGLMGSYTAIFGALFWLATRGGRALRKPSGGDLAYLTIGAYKLSRVVTMSFIGSPIRAPFTTRGESKKGGEVQDEARGQGLQRAIGNLVTCPFCFNVWSTTLFAFGYTLLPRVTTQAARILTMAAAGDVLHHGYRTLREKSE